MGLLAIWLTTLLCGCASTAPAEDGVPLNCEFKAAK